MTIDVAVGRYWKAKGQLRKDAVDYHGVLERIVFYFGKDKRLDEIDNQAIFDLVAHRRNQYRWEKTKLKHAQLKTVTNATVNRHTLVPLRAVFRFAKLLGCHLPNEPEWKTHLLKEPKERVRELTKHEQNALECEMRADYKPWFEFLQLSARRLQETLIRWSDVNWDLKEIVSIGKAGKNIWTPFTPSICKILEDCRGHHPEFVFTYVAQRTTKGRVAGKRYPLTLSGVVTHWKRVLARSGVTNFRLHDNRHDTATKLLRLTKNLKLVQRVLNHSDITSTVKYAHVMPNEVADALERNAESRNNPRNNPDEHE
ncbi:tyrosine-type recombinase/integrase [Rhizobium herbae]